MRANTLAMWALIAGIPLATGCGDKDDPPADDTGTPSTTGDDGGGDDGGGDDGGDTRVDADQDGWQASVDCDDDDPEINPGVDEICDGVDNNCDDLVDNDAVDGFTAWIDADGDGVGNDFDDPVVVCELSAGFSLSSDDCDDAEPLSYPDNTEICDEIDNDCDGVVDTDATDADTWYVDADKDGYGKDSGSVDSCDKPSGSYASEGGDCDDTDTSINPARAEICGDSKDNDCDSQTDEADDGAAIGSDPYYPDLDEDGFGDATGELWSCTQPSGYIEDDTDCDDTTADVRPTYPELCDDSVDNDCNGTADDADCVDVPTSWTGLEVYAYANGASESYDFNCVLLWYTEGAPTNTCVDCDFAFEVEGSYSKAESDDDGSCTSLAVDFSSGYGYAAAYYGAGYPSVLREYSGTWYPWSDWVYAYDDYGSSGADLVFYGEGYLNRLRASGYYYSDYSYGYAYVE